MVLNRGNVLYQEKYVWINEEIKMGQQLGYMYLNFLCSFQDRPQAFSPDISCIKESPNQNRAACILITNIDSKYLPILIDNFHLNLITDIDRNYRSWKPVTFIDGQRSGNVLITCMCIFSLKSFQYTNLQVQMFLKGGTVMLSNRCGLFQCREGPRHGWDPKI